MLLSKHHQHATTAVQVRLDGIALRGGESLCGPGEHEKIGIAECVCMDCVVQHSHRVLCTQTTCQSLKVRLRVVCLPLADIEEDARAASVLHALHLCLPAAW